MVKIINIVFLYAFVFGISLIPAQNRSIDSLRALINLPGEDTIKVNSLNSLCKIYINHNAFLRADSLSTLSLELAEKIDFKAGVFNSLINKGVVHWYRSNYPKALNNNFKALRIAEEMNNKLFVSRSLANVGLIYLSRKEHEKALEYYFRALKIKEEIGDKRGITAILSNIGQIFYEKKDYEKAMVYYLKSLEACEKLPNSAGLVALNSSKIGNVLRDKGELENAEEYFFKALRLAEENDQKSLICGASISLADLFMKKQKYALAEEYLTKSLSIAAQTGDLNNKKDAYLHLSKLDEKTNRWVQALENYKQFVLTQDSIFNEENTKQSVRLEMNYEFDKIEQAEKLEQDKKDAIGKEEKEKQLLLRNSFVGAFLFVLLLALLILKGYKNKQKANYIIIKQKDEVEDSKRVIEEQKLDVEEKQKEVLDSIRYAKRIQTALITNEKYIERNLNRLIKG